MYGTYYEKIQYHIENVENNTYNLDTVGNIFASYPRAGHVTCFLDMMLTSGLLASGVNAITDQRGYQTPAHMVPMTVGALVAW